MTSLNGFIRTKPFAPSFTVVHPRKKVDGAKKSCEAKASTHTRTARGNLFKQLNLKIYSTNLENLVYHFPDCSSIRIG